MCLLRFFGSPCFQRGQGGLRCLEFLEIHRGQVDNANTEQLTLLDIDTGSMAGFFYLAKQSVLLLGHREAIAHQFRLFGLGCFYAFGRTHFLLRRFGFFGRLG